MRRVLVPMLWCAFGLLILAGGALFLRACGTTPGFPWAQNFCPVPPDLSALRRAAEDGEQLRREVHASEIRLAEMPPCPASPAPVPRPPTPRPHPVTPQQRAESRSMDRRVEQRGGNRGKVQFTLSWGTTDDLDIDVDCPGGQISSFPGHRGPGVCGDGVKDIDANRNLVENVSTTPVENVSWADDVPDGTYVITIIEFKARSKQGSVVPFSLRMRAGDDEKICHDVVTTLPEAQFHREGQQTISGTYRTITWRSGEPLPDCNFKVENAVRGDRSK